MGQIPEGRKPLTWKDMTPKHSSWEAEAKALRVENERLRKRLADCVVWMDTREKQVPGMLRICDVARAALGDGQ